MKRSTAIKLLMAAVLGLCAAFGIIDPASAAMFFFIGDIEEVDSVLAKALSDHAGALKQFIEKNEERQKKNEEWQRKHDDRLLELEQKAAGRPLGDGSSGNAEDEPGALTRLLMKSDGLAMFQKGTSRAVEIAVPRKLLKTAILNATLDNNQPLVTPDRRAGIVYAPQRRFTIRNLLPNLPTSSNLVEFTSELAFTNNAGPQGGGSSPVETEGQLKNESGMTFALSSAPVITLAHWLPASRQVLSDAPQLQGHVENRLLYGLKLKEEDQFLNGDGTNGDLNGLINNATTFNRGSTGLTALDAVALGLAQLIGGEYEPSGIVLNPADWWSSKFMLAKNSQGEYLLGNPGSMAEPRLWGLPVVVTNSMPSGNFLVLDAPRVGFIADREEAIVRIAEQHADFFVRNMVVILVEERVTIVVQLGAAMIYGSLTF